METLVLEASFSDGNAAFVRVCVQKDSMRVAFSDEGS